VTHPLVLEWKRIEFGSSVPMSQVWAQHNLQKGVVAEKRKRKFY
jgi:hypothetical protein